MSKLQTKRTNLEKRKIDLIKESICVYEKCMECKTLYKEGRLCFTNIEDFVDDKGNSCLFRLKEMCHELFRHSDEANYKEKLYDITVGYIFHEAMKLRENLYQLEYYKPNCEKNICDFTEIEKKIVHELNLLVKKAEKRLKEGLKEVKILLRELVAQLRDLINLYKDNYLLPRFIFENERSLITIYGRAGYKRLLKELYKDGRQILLLKAAKSYLDSEYFDISRGLLRKATLMDKDDRTAGFLYMYSSAFHFYFKNKFSKALIFAQNALSINLEGDNDMPAYKERLKNLLTDIKRELNRKKF